MSLAVASGLPAVCPDVLFQDTSYRPLIAYLLVILLLELLGWAVVCRITHRSAIAGPVSWCTTAFLAVALLIAGLFDAGKKAYGGCETSGELFVAFSAHGAYLAAGVLFGLGAYTLRRLAANKRRSGS